jgi:hypothetical protein
MPDDYASQVARMRQQRRMEELDTDYRQAIVAREEALRQRQEIKREAAGVDAGDTEMQQHLKDEWHYHDAEVQHAEADLQRLSPRQAPPLSAAKQEWVRRVQPLLRKYGEAGYKALDVAHQRAIAAGHKEDSQAYVDHQRTDLEMNGHLIGVPTKPEDTQELTQWEACKASGISWAEYQKQAKIYADKKAQGEV